MSHGVVMVTTSNRHPDDLYKNGIQREHFIPCIKLLKTELIVLNLNSETDYRKIPRPPSGVYHHPLDAGAAQHADKWFEYLGDPVNDPPHPATHEVWGRKVEVPLASGKAARFTFQQLLGQATGAADYLELVRHYEAFIVTDVPAMTMQQRDLARRFITFIDAVYESKVCSPPSWIYKSPVLTLTGKTGLDLGRSAAESVPHRARGSIPLPVPRWFIIGARTGDGTGDAPSDG